MSVLHRKLAVRDLRFPEVTGSLFGHELRPLRPLADPRLRTLADAFASCGTLRCRVSRPAFWLSAAAYRHGLCAAHLAGGIARHCRLPQCTPNDSLSSWLSGAFGEVHIGRCERTTRLAALGGFGQSSHAKSPPALRWGGLGVGDRQHGLCPRFDDRRSFSDALSLGQFSQDQGGDQDAHPDRSAWADPHVHLHLRRPPARRALDGRSDFRTRRHLCYRPGLHGFRPPPSHCGGRSVLCHPSQRLSNSPGMSPGPWTNPRVFAATKSESPSCRKRGQATPRSCARCIISTRKPGGTWFF